MKKIILPMLLAASAPLMAANYANEVLAIGVGARAMGMGGAFVGLADDNTAVYWNPAGLPAVKHVEVAAIQQGKGAVSEAMKTNDVDSEYMYLSGATTIPQFGSLGAGFLRFGVKDIDYVPDQVIPASGEPEVKGKFSTQDLGFQLAYGRNVVSGLNLGLGLKYLTGGTSGLDSNASYSDYGLDLGVLLKFGDWASPLEGLSFGMNVQDIYNSGVKWTNTLTNPTDPVDPNFKVGVCYAPPLSFLKSSKSRWNLLVDMDTKYSPVTLLHYGTEFWFKDTIGLRAGARSFMGENTTGGTSYKQSTEISVGASVHILFLTVDYSYINYELTPIQYLSMGVAF